MFEKPLANTLPEANRIAELAESSDCECYVAFKYRCSAAIQKVRTLVESGRLGEVYHVEATDVYTRAIPAIGDWMTTRNLSGGGALIDLGTHTIDAAHHIGGFGDVDTAAGVARQQFDPVQYDPTEANDPPLFGKPGDRIQSDVEDSMSSLIEFEGGGSITLETHWAANVPKRLEFWVYGSDAGCQVNVRTDTVTLYEYTDEEPVSTFDTAEGDPDRIPVLDEFIGAIEDETTVLAGLDEARLVQRVIDRIYAGARTL
jgi:predicted dehydrogenase